MVIDMTFEAREKLIKRDSFEDGYQAGSNSRQDEIDELQTMISSQNSALAQKDSALAQKDATLTQKDVALIQMQEELNQ